MLISCAVTAQLICAFVFPEAKIQAKIQFSRDLAQIKLQILKHKVFRSYEAGVYITLKFCEERNYQSYQSKNCNKNNANYDSRITAKAKSSYKNNAICDLRL